VHPWLITGPYGQVPTYLAAITLGFTMAAVALGREVRRSALPHQQVFDIALLVLPAAWLGSRLFMVFEQPGVYLADPWRIVSPQGGYVFYGGFLAAAALVLLRARRLGLDPWKVGDVFAPTLPFGIVFARLGCLGAGCCHGRPADFPLGVNVPWSVRYYRLGHLPEELLGVPLHPSPLYESLLGLGLYLWLQRVRRAPRYDGQAMAVLFGGYGAGRFVLEWFRGDLERGTHLGGMLWTSQVFGLGSVAVALGIWAWRTRCTGS
jgi:phosphatidylglycerol:prolipoprotein diacylglycerol transferase